jgi:DNA-binding LacI/PurR family transcriptional regulator
MIKCIRCKKVNSISKAGKVRNLQRYYCRHCNLHFTKGPALEKEPSRKAMVTLQDIAFKLSLSATTVSKALLNKPDISEATRKKVQELAGQLDYRPNILAQGLRKSKTNVIGIIVPELNNNFFSSIIMGAQEIVSVKGFNVLITQSAESYETEVANVKQLIANRVDGVLISVTSETKNFEHFTTFGKYGIPIVFFNRICESIDTPKVVVNDYDGAFRAVEQLIGQGCTRIAHIAGPNNLLLSKKRLEGYRDALKKHQLPAKEEWLVYCDLSQENAKACARQLLSLRRKPDAIFAVNDPVGIQVILTGKENGIRIPEELCVIGFSNDPVSGIIEPGLSTMAQPTKEIGRAAAGILLDMIENKPDAAGSSVLKIIDAELIVRKSSDKNYRNPINTVRT